MSWVVLKLVRYQQLAELQDTPDQRDYYCIHLKASHISMNPSMEGHGTK
jgi:hypothetical protein